MRGTSARRRASRFWPGIDVVPSSDWPSDDVAPRPYFFSIFQNTGVAGPPSTPDERFVLQALGAKYCPSGM